MGTKQENLDAVARGIHSHLRTMTSNNEPGEEGISADNVAQLFMDYLAQAHDICGICSDDGTLFKPCKLCGKKRN